MSAHAKPSIAKARKLLGIAAETGPDEAARAFRIAAKAAHPDRGGDPARFRAVVEAWRLIQSHAPAPAPARPPESATRTQLRRFAAAWAAL